MIFFFLAIYKGTLSFRGVAHGTICSVPQGLAEGGFYSTAFLHLSATNTTHSLSYNSHFCSVQLLEGSYISKAFSVSWGGQHYVQCMNKYLSSCPRRSL